MCRRKPISHKEAMKALQTVKLYCDDYDEDNTNRIEQTPEQLSLTLDQWKQQLARHIDQRSRFYNLRLLVTGAIDCMSKISYRNED